MHKENPPKRNKEIQKERNTENALILFWIPFPSRICPPPPFFFFLFRRSCFAPFFFGVSECQGQIPSQC